MIKSWVVSILSAFDGIMHMVRIGANTKEDAVYGALLHICKDQDTRLSQGKWNDEMRAKNLDFDGIEKELDDADMSVGALEV